ncbi:hypothetical protein [Magnetospirillum moscoviense]|uniref:Motility protein n=1 Tax=Magnetospirillum moscoviense TaxID=1437059 RepID=A0A178MI39_9PROT|nr:hypothetical protein [Magnetospirillum moscoviense]MBF0324041.1 hypothetical protein [Alphaproteobacteria bacterium]OAN47735.1 hypothetical protein A6A05_15450 [Magnetospirillum moscoviense]
MDIGSVADMALVMRREQFGHDMAARMLKQAAMQEATALHLVTAAAQGQPVAASTAAINVGGGGHNVNITV